MDANHVEAAVNFPNTFPRFRGQGFAERADKELALACIRDLQRLDDRRVVGRRRARPSDPADAGAAVGSRARRRGGAPLRGQGLATPSRSPRTRRELGFATMHSGTWDPLWEACDETGTVVTMHIGSSSQMPTTSPRRAARRVACRSARRTRRARCATGSSRARSSASRPQVRLRREPDRLDAVPARAMDIVWKEGVGGVEPAQRAELLRSRSRVRLHLRRPARAQLPRRGRHELDPVRDRLPARRRHLAALTRGRAPLVPTAGMNAADTYAFLRGNAIEAFGLERFGITR